MFSFWLTSAAQPWAFFSLPARAWELALGGILAVAGTRLSLVPERVAAVAGWIGVALHRSRRDGAERDHAVPRVRRAAADGGCRPGHRERRPADRVRTGAAARHGDPALLRADLVLALPVALAGSRAARGGGNRPPAAHGAGRARRPRRRPRCGHAPLGGGPAAAWSLHRRDPPPEPRAGRRLHPGRRPAVDGRQPLEHGKPGRPRVHCIGCHQHPAARRDPERPRERAADAGPDRHSAVGGGHGCPGRRHVEPGQCDPGCAHPGAERAARAAGDTERPRAFEPAALPRRCPERLPRLLPGRMSHPDRAAALDRAVPVRGPGVHDDDSRSSATAMPSAGSPRWSAWPRSRAGGSSA